jgi:hypothetical protein
MAAGARRRKGPESRGKSAEDGDEEKTGAPSEKLIIYFYEFIFMGNE